MITIDEQINVWVLFKENFIQPYSFFWHKRMIKVDKINLIHTSKNGNQTFYHFSVSASGNFYRLKFDVGNLKWMLEAVEEE